MHLASEGKPLHVVVATSLVISFVVISKAATACLWEPLQRTTRSDPGMRKEGAVASAEPTRKTRDTRLRKVTLFGATVGIQYQGQILKHIITRRAVSPVPLSEMSAVPVAVSILTLRLCLHLLAVRE